MSETLPIADAKQTRAWLWSELRVRRGEVAGTLAVGVLAAAASIIPIYALGMLVDRARHQLGLEGADASAIVPIAIVIVASALVGGGAMGWSSYLIGRLGARMLADLRESTIATALRLPALVLDKVGRGDLLSRVGADIAAIGKAVSDVLPNVISALLLGVLSLAAMAGIDWRLGLAGAVAVPFYVFALRWYLPRSAPRYALQRKAVAERSQLLVESMQGIRTVHAYRLEERHVRDIDRVSAKARDIDVGVFTLFTRFVGRVNRAEFFGLAAILVVGFLLVRSGAVTVGQTSAAALLFHRLFNPVSTLMFTFDEIQAAGASLSRLVGVETMPVEHRGPGRPPAAVVLGHRGAVRPPEAAALERRGEGRPPAAVVLGRRGEGRPPAAVVVGRRGEGRPPAAVVLELSNVDFSYDSRSAVLRDVSIRVEPGERVALVGSTGAGKTTLALIAAGILRPSGGAARVGGVPVTELPPETVAIVSQETHVFAGPLVEDLRLARPAADVAEVEEALATVGALEWAQALPEGLETVVGDGGQHLTPAQAQQLALARLVLLNPAVAVLDEATAEAGSSGARALEEAAAAATEGRTVLVVAHRLTQAASADRVIVMEHGVIVESGPHAELVAAGGRYAQLWSAWESRSSAPAQS
ncbi:MAG: ABC transporter ATP-binding protein [Actinoplanes sp.]